MIKIKGCDAACDHCTFYAPQLGRDKEELEEGSCRYSPPKEVMMPTQRGPVILGVWPSVKRDGWCRMFEFNSDRAEIVAKLDAAAKAKEPKEGLVKL